MIKTIEPQFIKCNLNLPNHEEELTAAKRSLTKIKQDLTTIFEEDSINNIIHEYYYEEIIRILDYVGHLSSPAFEINKQLEDMYFKKFKKSPQLARKLWLDHYESIHSPYNKLKNISFKLLDLLDENYQNKFKRNPPNWNI